tara:strand:- start:632 stop:1624 length:993 start_codon:yes stop_codon:yes gene_type:complete
MDNRKVQELGGGTAFISLPKSWIKKNQIKRGNILSIEILKDDSLIIYSPNKIIDLKKIEITYPNLDIDKIINEVIGAYLLGYDIIQIKGKQRLNFKDMKQIIQTVRHLVGLEIIEEDANSITTQFLLESETLNPKKLLERMHGLVKEMYKDAIVSLLENDDQLVDVAIERDEEVDRLYFLLVRLIRSNILNTKLSIKFDLLSIDYLDYRVAANILETIGDNSVELAITVKELRTMTLKSQLKKLLHEFVIELNDIQDLSINLFLLKKISDRNNVINKYNKLNQKLFNIENLMLDEKNTVIRSSWTLLTTLDKILKSMKDITDLAVPIKIT